MTVSSAAQDFTGFLRAHLTARKIGDYTDVVRIAAEQRAGERVIRILKSPVPAGGIRPGEDGWMAPMADYQIISSGFLELLRTVGIFDRLLTDAKRVPIRRRIGITSIGASASTVAEGGWKPVSRLTFETDVLAPQKAVSIVVLSDDAVSFSAEGSMQLIQGELRNAVALETDVRFIATLAAGVTPVASSGSDNAAAREDVRQLILGVDLGQLSRPTIVMGTGNVKNLATQLNSLGLPAFPEMTVRGGAISGVPVLPSDAIAADKVMLVDMSRVGADAGDVAIDVSNAAALQMDSAPTEAASNLVSLFQTNSVAIRAERTFGARKMTTECVAIIEGAEYIGGTGSP